MLGEQINALQMKELEAMEVIESAELALKKAKAELVVIKRAKQSLERLEEQLNGQTDISE